MHKALAAFSAFQLLLSIAALLYFDSLNRFDTLHRWTIILFYLMINGNAWKYYYERAALRAARCFRDISTEAGTHGWVAKDAIPLLYLAISILLTIGLVVQGLPPQDTTAVPSSREPSALRTSANGPGLDRERRPSDV
jgi:hypothetical protein